MSPLFGKKCMVNIKNKPQVVKQDLYPTQLPTEQGQGKDTKKTPLHILIVEDNHIDADLMTIRLKKEGLVFNWERVDTEADFLTALNYPPDVILSDWILPGFSGLRALQLINDRKLKVPFIVITGSIGEEAAVEALHQGAYDYLIKDRLERLGQVVSNALDQKLQNEQRKKTEDIQILQTAALNATANAIVITDSKGTIEWTNPAFSTLTGYTSSEAIGKNPRDLVKSDSQDSEFYRQMWKTILDGDVWRGELINRKKNGQLYTEDQTITPVRNSAGIISQFISIKQDITDRKKAEDIFQKLSRVVDQTTEIVFVTDLEGVIEYVNPSFESLTGFSKEEALGKTPRILKSGKLSAKDYEALWATILAGKILHGVVVNRKKNGELYHQETTISPLRDSQGKITHFVSTGIDITERLLAEEKSKSRFAELEAVNQISTALRVAQTLDEMLPLLLDETLKVLGSTLGNIRLYDKSDDDLKVAVSRGYGGESDNLSIPPEKAGIGISGSVYASGQPYISSEYRTDLHLPETQRNHIPSGIGGVTVPIRAATNVIGTLSINVVSPRKITESELKLLITLSEIAGNAIHRTSLKQQTERQLLHLTSLREIDQAIISSFDLKLNLGTILTQATSQLGVDAAGILLFNPVSQTLDFAAGRGFFTKSIEQTRLRLGESHAGKAALERRIVHLPDLQDAAIPPFTPSLEDEKFVSFYAVPLIVKGQIKGVMELFHRNKMEPGDDWLSFVYSLAGQAAIAIDNSTLFEDLQRLNTELSLAYDSTIEGWSRALDLRDEETEGHTQRVTDMTIKLASVFGISGDDLTQIRWGALLHDIGKMGVPDGILLKPGPLSAEEWVIMKKHTTYAFEMLSPIRYLRYAIDIPYCHHEKWDGTGYPRGLKGDQIPLSARIFAVVDVWDALSSDRPYRLAWPKKKIITHIRSLSGTHFDPKVLKTCLESGLLGN